MITHPVTADDITVSTADTAPITVPELPAGDHSPEALATMLRETLARLQEANAHIAEQDKKIRELEDLASTDPLTGLMNRRGLEVFFEQELARIRRGTSSGAMLVLLDLDGFKQLNDTYGHQAGDECLKKIAAEVLSSIRFTDGAARLGGDEFAILLTHTTTQKICPRVASIREALNAVSFKWNNQTLTSKASLGTAPVTANDEGFATAYTFADAALYQDKALRKGKAPSPAR